MAIINTVEIFMKHVHNYVMDYIYIYARLYNYIAICDCLKLSRGVATMPREFCVKLSFHCIILVLLLCSSDCGPLATNPGFRTALTTKGLDYICQITVPILEKELSTLTIPDISGSASTPVGSIDYELKKIQLSNLQIPTSSLTSSTAGLTIQASDISLHVYADWQYREHSWPHIEDHGNCDINVWETSLEVDIKVGTDSTGHATLSTTYCHLYLKKLDIDFHGGASWLYNLFSSYISNDLRDSIENQVCSVISQMINIDGTEALKSIPVNVKIDSTSEIDFALIQNPIISSAYVETLHKGEFYDISHKVEAPFTPPALPAVTEKNTSMLYLWLTDYMADTAGFVYQTAGVMHYTITPSMVPPNFPFQLNTSSFNALIPQLYNKFPDWGMQLELEATKPPLLSLSPAGGYFTVFGEVVVYVVSPSNSSIKQQAFVLGTTVDANATFYLNISNVKELICGNATFLKVDLVLLSTNIGQFNVSVLQAAVDLLSTLFIIPSINHYANAGIPIPTVDGISLVKASLMFGKDYVLVATDIMYL